MSDFDTIATQQGWSESTQLDILRSYISNQQDNGALTDFATQVAADENEGSEFSDPDRDLLIALAERHVDASWRPCLDANTTLQDWANVLGHAPTTADLD